MPVFFTVMSDLLIVMPDSDRASGGYIKKTTTSRLEKMADSNSKRENERLCIIL